MSAAVPDGGGARQPLRIPEQAPPRGRRHQLLSTEHTLKPSCNLSPPSHRRPPLFPGPGSTTAGTGLPGPPAPRSQNLPLPPGCMRNKTILCSQGWQLSQPAQLLQWDGFSWTAVGQGGEGMGSWWSGCGRTSPWDSHSSWCVLLPRSQPVCSAGSPAQVLAHSVGSELALGPHQLNPLLVLLKLLAQLCEIWGHGG